MIIEWPKDDATTGRMRWPYEAGLFGRSVITDAVAYGRSLGLTVTDLRGGGLLTVRGYILAEGRARELRRFAHAMSELS